MAMNRSGEWTPGLAKKLTDGDTMAQVRDVLLGRAEIRMFEHLIDCSAAPYVPLNKMDIDSHKRSGELRWDPKNFRLYRSKKQKKDGSITGYELQNELKDKPVLNANVLDYLLAHKELIPRDWVGRSVFFWGTIYLMGGTPVVRCIQQIAGVWDQSFRWLSRDFSAADPAIMLHVAK